MTKQPKPSKGASATARLLALAIAPTMILSSCGGLSKSDRETVEIPPAPVGGDPTSADPTAMSGAEAVDAESKPPMPATPPYSLETAEKYVVQPGDTVSGIATQYGVSTNDIKVANKISNVNKIRAGQVLLVPGNAAEAEPEAAGDEEATTDLEAPTPRTEEEPTGATIGGESPSLTIPGTDPGE